MDLMEPINAFDRLPPHSIDAEKCLIASLMLCDSPVVFATVKSLVKGGDFFQADHQIIFDELMRMQSAGVAIDAVTLVNALDARKLLDEIGGRAYVGEILQSIPSPAHFEHYAKIVREKALLRAAIAIANDLLRDAYLPMEFGEADTVLSRGASKLALAAIQGKGQQVHRLGDAMLDVAARRHDPKSFARIKTGLTELDELIGGLLIGGDTIIAGKPGMAKSALLKQLAKNIASEGVCVGIISVEETRHKIAENALASAAQVANNRIAFGTASNAEWVRIESAAGEFSNLPVFIVDCAFSISQILSMADLLVYQHGCSVIMVDHVHLIDAEPEKHQNREREISKISGALKMAWKRLNVAGIKAAQLNRSSGRERPTKENMRDSGSLEQDGDVIILLHREDYYRKQDAKNGEPVELDGVLELIVDKNKSGAVGTVAVHFEEKYQLIHDMNFSPNADLAESQFNETFGYSGGSHG